MAKGWPITEADLRKALGYEKTQGDTEELRLYAQAACERIDEETGRDVDPHRHEKADGALPINFYVAARILARMAWQQDKNGPRGLPQGAGDQPTGIQGIDLPRRVQGILALYSPPPGFGQPAQFGGS